MAYLKSNLSEELEVGVAVENKRVRGLEIQLEDGSIRAINVPEEYNDFPLEYALMMTLNDEIEEFKEQKEAMQKNIEHFINDLKEVRDRQFSVGTVESGEVLSTVITLLEVHFTNKY